MFALVRLKCQIVDLISSFCLNIILPSKECDSQAQGAGGRGQGAGGEGGHSGFQVTGMIKWGQQSKPKGFQHNFKKSLDQKLTPKNHTI